MWNRAIWIGALGMAISTVGTPCLAQQVDVGELQPTRALGASDYHTIIDRDDRTWGALLLNVPASFAGDGDDLALLATGGRDLSLSSLGGGNVCLQPTGTGRVGIGTTAPAAKLHLTADDSIGFITSVSHPNDWNYGALVQVDRNRAKALAVENTTTGVEAFAVLGNGEVRSKVGWGHWMRFDDSIGDNSYFFHNSQNGNRFEVGILNGGNYNWGVLTITEDGDLGIGTTQPSSRLEVSGGDLTVSGGNLIVEGHDIVLGTDDGRDRGARPRQRALVHGNVAVGANFEDTLMVNYAGDFEGGVEIHGPRVVIGARHVAQGPHQDYRLAVDGKVVATEVVVTVDGWKDSVFRPGHELLPLDQVRQFVETHHHLPGIPSEAEVLEQGVPLGEMSALLLEKIEELTLHVIALEQRAASLGERNIELESRLARLESGQ